MEERQPERDVGAERYFEDAALARRFQRRLHEVRPETYARDAIKYDESGYPIPPRRPGMAGRLRRLIAG